MNNKLKGMLAVFAFITYLSWPLWTIPFLGTIKAGKIMVGYATVLAVIGILVIILTTSWGIYSSFQLKKNDKLGRLI